MALSDAVGLERVSRIVGYKLEKGFFNESSPNLPQRIAIFSEVNTANQATVSDTEPRRITSAQDAGEYAGWGSPAHIISRILFPTNGGGTIGGIPVYLYPQLEAVGATATEYTITASGTATSNATHYVVVNGRYGLDGDSYAVNIAIGDTATAIATKIYNTINNVLGCPVSATVTSPLSAVATCTSKWKGETSKGVNIRIDVGNDDAGITYSVVRTTTGSGTPSVTDALNLFSNEWNTLVINSYGLLDVVCDEFESFNGIPDQVSPTGRYQGIVFKPFVAVTGTVEDVEPTSDDALFTDARKTQVTIAVAPAPLSEGFAMEAAANAIALEARIAQDTPHLDIAGLSYPDMPIPYQGTPAMSNYDTRDALVKMGMSTVDIVSGAYQVQDFVTTYHPVGEVPPQFRYVRNLMLDFNVRYGYYLLEQVYVVGHMLTNDNTVTSVSRVIKPKIWKGVLKEYATDLGLRGLISDVPFMQDNTEVGIDSSNPDRMQTRFKYKRTGTVRISSTNAVAGFNLGNA